MNRIGKQKTEFCFVFILSILLILSKTLPSFASR